MKERMRRQETIVVRLQCYRGGDANHQHLLSIELFLRRMLSSI
jgi:hypothetical protein